MMKSFMELQKQQALADADKSRFDQKTVEQEDDIKTIIKCL